jgi:hypothetical protein
MKRSITSLLILLCSFSLPVVSSLQLPKLPNPTPREQARNHSQHRSSQKCHATQTYPEEKYPILRRQLYLTVIDSKEDLRSLAFSKEMKKSPLAFCRVYKVQKLIWKRNRRKLDQFWKQRWQHLNMTLQKAVNNPSTRHPYSDLCPRSNPKERISNEVHLTQAQLSLLLILSQLCSSPLL